MVNVLIIVVLREFTKVGSMGWKNTTNIGGNGYSKGSEGATNCENSYLCVSKDEFEKDNNRSGGGGPRRPYCVAGGSLLR